MDEPTFFRVLCAFLVLHKQLHAVNSADNIVKVWRQNMNFGNGKNWDGLNSDCAGGQIFSFPSYMDPAVITMPSDIKAKQIILPSDGALVFQSGLTKFSDDSKCPLKEATFNRQGPADWFDPENWLVNGSVSVNRAVAHVERVPCQFDAVKFKGNSSFSVRISKAVAVEKFYWGNESLSHADVGLLMSSPLGSIQFRKTNEIPFAVTDSACSGTKKDCVCINYQEQMKRHICSLTQCKESEEENCPIPITPHGFCCPICGYHMTINHKPGYSLESTSHKLNQELKAVEGIDGYATRYKENGAHIVLVPWTNKSADAFGVVLKMRAFLSQDSTVLDVTVAKSWEHVDGYAEASSTGMSNAGMYFLVLFIVLLLAGAALGIFYWRRSGLTVTSIWPSCPTINIPTNLTASSSTPSFAFARFANERISHLNLRPDFGETIERTERVDNEVVPQTIEMPSSSTEAIIVEFANNAYEAVVDPAQPSGSARAGKVNGKNNGKSKDYRRESDAQPLVEDEHVYDLIEVDDNSAAVLDGKEAKTEE